jgi:hypothetical protein
VFVADITDEFILGLDIRWAYDISADVGRHVLRLGREEVLVKAAPTLSVLTWLQFTDSCMNRQLVCWRCGDTKHLRSVHGGLPRRWSTNTTGELDGEMPAEAVSTPTSLRGTLLFDERQQLEIMSQTWQNRSKS